MMASDRWIWVMPVWGLKNANCTHHEYPSSRADCSKSPLLVILTSGRGPTRWGAAPCASMCVPFSTIGKRSILLSDPESITSKPVAGSFLYV